MDVFFPFNFTQSFTACQIYEVQGRVKSVILIYLLLNVDPKYGVRARTVFMNMRFFVDSVFFTVIHQTHCLVESPNLLLLKTSYTNTMILIIGQLEILGVFVEQVVNAFVVYFQIGDPNFEIMWIVIRLNPLKDVSNSTWQNTR